MPSDSGAAWSPPALNSERRLSNSSDGSAGSGYSKATTDNADFLATRPHTAAVLPGKPAGNPLQFVRVGPADLGSRAREQLRRAELAKRTEPVRLERQEDWQSNLDNWKSSRRKRVEHIIDRCVEVRRMENEPSQPLTKSKTFNEMLEERAGRRRRNPLALYTEDDVHDLSDLGIGTSSTKSSLSEDCDTHSLTSDGIDLDKNSSDVDNLSNDISRKLGSSANEYDTCTTTTISSPEPEEYTYEGAIEGYKSRIISQTNSSTVKTFVKNKTFKDKSSDKLNEDFTRIKTTVSNKVKEKVSSLKETNTDTKYNNQKNDLPKLHIHKRRERFERENSQKLQAYRPKLPAYGNAIKRIIKDRSIYVKFPEETCVHKSRRDFIKLPTEVRTLKDRLPSLEKIKSGSIKSDNKRLSNGNLKNVCLKDLLSSLKSQTSEEVKIQKTEVKEVSMSLKERLACLDAEKHKKTPKISVDEQIKLSKTEANTSDSKENDISLKSSLTGIEKQMQSFCRSLDSLDINGRGSSHSFERVQSLEHFDCAERQNHSVASDIKTKDSGMLTARDSCAPADYIADLTQIASPVEEPMIEVFEFESSNELNTIPVKPTKVEKSTDKSVNTNKKALQDIFVEEVEEQESKTEDTDSGRNYTQAISQPKEPSFTEEVTEIQTDKEDEDILRSLDNHNSSVIDALELAFKELDSEDSSVNSSAMEDKSYVCNGKTYTPLKKEAPWIDFDSDTKIQVAPLYDNMFYQNMDESTAFPLDFPTNSSEPPKEKPPPPPPEPYELLGDGNFKHTSSALRVKKEIKKKRTSFLGIDGQVDGSYLDVDLALLPRPDITSFLQEETKIKKPLHKKTLSHDMDNNLRESRDSGVDVYRGPLVEAWCKGQSSSETSNPHSRQNSEEVLRFERELLQLEQEELRRQRENLLRDQARIIEKSVQDVSTVPASPEKPSVHARPTKPGNPNYRHSMPNLLVHEGYTPVAPIIPERPAVDENIKRKPFVSEEHIQSHFGVEESRRVLYEERAKVAGVRRQVPTVARQTQPVLPPKPRLRESIQREITMRSSRVPSAVEYVIVDQTTVQLRPKPSPLAQSANNRQYHPITRHTQALSAAPAPKLIANMDWMQGRSRKPANYNYNQHWLIQEAEQRRIEEQRSNLRANKRNLLPQDAAPPPTLHNMHPLSSSQQNLLQEYKQPSRPEVSRLEPLRDELLLSVSGKKRCSHCGEELGRGAAMIIESLSLCYHVWCFTCAVCGTRLGDGRAGADVRVRGNRLHCHQCYSGDDGRKYSCV